MIFVGVIILSGCEDPADSPECKEWQMNYKVAEQYDMEFIWMKSRPDGCPIP